MATTNISILEKMREWVHSRTESGQYANNSDYIRCLIRQDQLRQGKIRTMQIAIDEGLASGEAQKFDKDDFKKQMREHRDGQISTSTSR